MQPQHPIARTQCGQGSGRREGILSCVSNTLSWVRRDYHIERDSLPALLPEAPADRLRAADAEIDEELTRPHAEGVD
jgi:hypothetical protein